jgi:GNAT superfamily N-acetyltransferase
MARGGLAAEVAFKPCESDDSSLAMPPSTPACDPDVRRGGVGRALIEAVEDWARERGFRELGSDALLDNVLSHTAHQRLGFEERERTVTFRKFLTQ